MWIWYPTLWSSLVSKIFYLIFCWWQTDFLVVYARVGEDAPSRRGVYMARLLVIFDPVSAGPNRVRLRKSLQDGRRSSDEATKACCWCLWGRSRANGASGIEGFHSSDDLGRFSPSIVGLVQAAFLLLSIRVLMHGELVCRRDAKSNSWWRVPGSAWKSSDAVYSEGV